jgi:D-alanyl-lipoteichoic acid acyltransferase DltB (MBOAT superfamily)
MQAPMRATSLADFWGRRWNLGFRQLTHGLVFWPIRKRFGTAAATLAAFIGSGLVHDLVISCPAGGGYGLPTAYFLFQGIGVLVERSKAGTRVGIGHGFRGWLFTLLCTGGPAFWLFHPPFVRNVILPFFAWIGRL